MVQLVLSTDFKHQFLQWYGVTVQMKEPRGLLGQTYLTIREMREVAIQTTELVSKSEAIERLVKIIESNYVKAELEKVAANTTHSKTE